VKRNVDASVSTVLRPAIGPERRQNGAARANASQLAQSWKRKNVKNLRGKSEVVESRDSFSKPLRQAASRMSQLWKFSSVVSQSRQRIEGADEGE
jgi:hypothetical protein